MPGKNCLECMEKKAFGKLCKTLRIKSVTQ